MSRALSLTEASAFYDMLDERILATIYEPQAASFALRVKAREGDAEEPDGVAWVSNTRDAFFKQLQDRGGQDIAAAIERSHSLRGLHSALLMAENRK